MYRPLPSSQHTRVLEIQDGGDDTLVLAMNVIDLSEVVSRREQEQGDAGYDALSYTWGPPISGEFEALYDSSHDVEVTVLAKGSQHKRMIGRTLFEALSQIHKTTNLRPIWVDALCINQEDLDEKETHILLMGDVYSKAQRVVVWLGPDLYNDFEHILWLHTTVLDVIVAHVEEKGPLQRADFSRSIGSGGALVHTIPNLQLPDEALHALFRFYATRRYFERAWVVQEVALAYKCYALLGEHLVGFQRLYTLNDQLGDLGGQARMYVTGSLGNELRALGATAQQIQNWSTSTLRHDLEHLFGCTDETTSILALLLFYIYSGTVRRASDPKDLIYCLLGLAKHVYGGSVIRPDYRASTESVFTSFTTLLLEHLPHRTILSMVADKAPRAAYERLPSWVPDFVTSSHVPVEMHMAAHNGAWIDLSVCPGPRELVVQDGRLSLFGRPCAVIGKTFKIRAPPSEIPIIAHRDMILSYLDACKGGLDPVALMGTMCYGELEEDFERLGRMFLAMSAVEPRLGSNDPQVLSAAAEIVRAFELAELRIVPSQEDLANVEELLLASSAFERTSTNDWAQYLDYIGLLHRIFPEYDWDEVVPRLESPEMDSWLERAAEFTAYAARRVVPYVANNDTFFAADKNVGRSPAIVLPGDELWLFCQAKVPFVLRPVGNEYRLLGEAYVHGGMFGELEKTAGEARKIVIV